MSTKKRKLRINTTRSVHQGRHSNKAVDKLKAKLDQINEIGKQNNYTPEQYKEGMFLKMD